MMSLIVWAVAVAIAVLLGLTSCHFSVRTLRAVTMSAVLVLLIIITADGLEAPGGGSTASLGSAFVLGADRVSAAFFHPFWHLLSTAQAPAPGRLGWIAIGVVLLAGYWLCEARAVRRQAPVLDTSKLGDGQPSIGAAGAAGATAGGTMTDGQRHDWLAAELKFRLAAVEVHSPPILPGGSRAGGLASIAEASGNSAGGLAGAIIRFLAMLWPSPHRYELRVWMEGTPPTRRAAYGLDAADSTRVTVELDDPRTGATIATKTVVAAGMDDAASMAAGYVARQIFARDPATPPWCYGAADGRDLGALVLSRQERTYVESAADMCWSRGRRIDVLRKVTGVDRCAGVVRYELAQLEDLDRKYLTALRLHALNREQYPRFFRGVYRLCMSLEMVADPDFPIPNPGAVRAILDEALDILYRSRVVTTDYSGEDLIHPEAASGRWVISHALRENLLEVARQELRRLRRQLSLPRVVWATFTRRSERTMWKPHWHLATRQGLRDGVCVAELLVAVKQRLNDLDEARGKGGITWPVEDQPHRGWPGAAERFRQRAGVRITAAVAGDTGPIETVLWRPFHEWPGRAESRPDEIFRAGRDRVRWLPWQARTASGPAAYNTACLYAVLVRYGLAPEEKVIASLRRLVGNRDSGMERPSDWISNDPDFAPLLREGSAYAKVRQFVKTQEKRDYPRREPYYLLPETTVQAPA
jgi:hypothetical protein